MTPEISSLIHWDSSKNICLNYSGNIFWDCLTNSGGPFFRNFSRVLLTSLSSYAIQEIPAGMLQAVLAGIPRMILQGFSSGITTEIPSRIPTSIFPTISPRTPPSFLGQEHSCFLNA